MSPAEQLAELAAKCDLHHNASARQVQGGFIVAGSTKYVDKDSGAVLAERNAETVASTPEAAGGQVMQFLADGKFA